MPTAQPRESLGLDRGGDERGGIGGEEEEAVASPAKKSESESEPAPSRPARDQGPSDGHETEAARHRCQEEQGAGAALNRGDDARDEEPPRPAKGHAEEGTPVPLASSPSKNQSATVRGRPPRRSPEGRRGRRLPHFRKLPSSRPATAQAMASKDNGQGRGNDVSLKAKDSEQEDNLIRTVATTNDIAGGGEYGDRADHPTGAGDPNPRHTARKPIRLVQSLTSSLARYRSPAHTVTFSPSEETLLVVLRPQTENDADDDDDVRNDSRDAIVVSSSSSASATASTSNASSMISSSSSSKSELTTGASDSSLSSHFVVTTTTLDDDHCSAEEVEVVVCPIGGTGPSFDPAATPLWPPGAATTSAATTTTTTEDLELEMDGPFVVHRAVVVAATTPRGGTIELVGGPTDIDPDDDDSGIVVSSDSDDVVRRGQDSTTGQHDVQGVDVRSAEEGEVTGVQAGKMVAKQKNEDKHDSGAVALVTWATNPCAPPGPTVVDSPDDGSVHSASFLPTSLLTPVTRSKTGFLWSSYPWLLFRTRETVALDADTAVPERSDEGDDDDDDAVCAEDRFVKLLTDAAALVHGQVDPMVDADNDETAPSPTKGHRGSSALAPNSPDPFTERQSRVLASLYARVNGSGNSTEKAEKEKPWDDPARMLRAGSASATAIAEEKVPKVSKNDVDKPSPNVWSASPPGRGNTNGLIRLARANHPRQKALDYRSRPGMTQPSGVDATFVTAKDVATEIQELTSLESSSQFSLPKNLLQFDFVLSSDLSSSYYGSSGAETRSTVVSSQEVNSNEIRNESTTSVDDSAMKRSSCDSSSDQAGSSGSMSPRLAEKDGTTGSSRPDSVAEHGSLSSIENRTKHEPKEAANIAKFGGESSADNALKANDTCSSSVEVVRYRVALGPLKFSYYARGRKKR